MKIFRFSLRRLMVLVGVAAAVLYVLVVRPPAMARAFARSVENAANGDAAAASERWFQGLRTTSETKFEYELLPRTWSQVVTGKQVVEVRLVTPETERTSSFFVELRQYSVNPIAVQALYGPVVEIRSRRN